MRDILKTAFYEIIPNRTLKWILCHILKRSIRLVLKKKISTPKQPTSGILGLVGFTHEEWLNDYVRFAAEVFKSSEPFLPLAYLKVCFLHVSQGGALCFSCLSSIHKFISTSWLATTILYYHATYTFKTIIVPLIARICSFIDHQHES